MPFLHLQAEYSTTAAVDYSITPPSYHMPPRKRLPNELVREMAEFSTFFWPYISKIPQKSKMAMILLKTGALGLYIGRFLRKYIKAYKVLYNIHYKGIQGSTVQYTVYLLCVQNLNGFLLGSTFCC